jgi:hypothetical protein
MTLSSIDPFHRRVAPRATAIAAASLCWLFAAPANAAFVPHPELTPYQIANDDNHCVQAQSIGGGPLTMAPCDAANNLQKFYLLNNGSDSDVVLQSVNSFPSVSARIVMAAALDSVPSPSGAYNLLNLVNVNTISIGSNLAHAAPAQVWRVSRAPVVTTALVFAAYEKPYQLKDYFKLAGKRSVYYGLDGRWIKKDVTADLAGTNTFACVSSFFGGDPNPEVPNICYYGAPAPVAYTKLMVNIANSGDLESCMGYDGALVHPVACAPVPRQIFTFRPTSYPR